MMTLQQALAPEKDIVLTTFDALAKETAKGS